MAFDRPKQFHPFERGDMVCHGGQEWAIAEGVATGVIHEVKGPLFDDTYEYLVTTTKDGSRPGPQNPLNDRRWWSSRMTYLIDSGNPARFR